MLSPEEALAALKSENARYVDDPRTVLDSTGGSAALRGRTPGPLGDDRWLRRQPRTAQTDLRRPRPRWVIRGSIDPIRRGWATRSSPAGVCGAATGRR